MANGWKFFLNVHQICNRWHFYCSLPIMSVRLNSVYLLQHSQNSMSPSTEKSSPLANDSPVSLPLQGSKAPTAVAIVTPQRSNSLDFLNFEEKRQIIASSLSLTDFLQHKHAQGSATTPTSPTTAKFILGKFCWKLCLFCFLLVIPVK